MHVYNHPNKSVRNFKETFNEFMNKHKTRMYGKALIIFGDFNIDFNVEPGLTIMRNFFGNHYGLEPTLRNTNTRFKSGGKFKNDIYIKLKYSYKFFFKIKIKIKDN